MGDAFPRTGGVARRLIDLRCEDDSTAIGWLEDDFHHFGISISHSGGIIQDVRTRSPRSPYSTCPAAGAGLKALIGQPLIERGSDIGKMVQMRQQCTHMFDLAGLVLAQAFGNRPRRRYEAIITDRSIVQWEEGSRRLLGPGRASLRLDSDTVLDWEIDRRAITGPQEWAGQSLIEGFRERTEASDIEMGEYATILRRAIMIAGGRTFDLDTFPTAGARGLKGMCYTFLDENRFGANRNMGSARNYEQSSAPMLAHVEEHP